MRAEYSAEHLVLFISLRLATSLSPLHFFKQTFLLDLGFLLGFRRFLATLGVHFTLLAQFLQPLLGLLPFLLLVLRSYFLFDRLGFLLFSLLLLLLWACIEEISEIHGLSRSVLVFVLVFILIVTHISVIYGLDLSTLLGLDTN